MKNRIIYLLGLACLLGLAGCHSKEGVSGGELPGRQEVVLRTESNARAKTKAAAGFPNDGRIAVLAAVYDTVAINWSSYPDIDNTGATAMGVSSGVYSFSWDQVKYWPFDNSYLVFMAYSPLSTEYANLALSGDRRTLEIALDDNMPDVMYASNNTTADSTPYNKTDRTVNLGEFRHALSQLTVEVVADPAMQPYIEVSGLSVGTQRSSGSLFLPQGDTGMIVPAVDAEFIYTLVESNTPFKDGKISKSVLLFPATEDYTVIYIDLVDVNTSLEVHKELAVSFFQNSTGTGEPIRLQRGKNTVLTITVKSIDVVTEDTELKGVISGWNYNGDFEVVIN